MKLVMVNIVRRDRRETKFVRVPVGADGKVRVDLDTLFQTKASDGCIGYGR